MVGLETFGANGQAVVDVGAVLAEAMVLYVGYGAVTDALSGTVRRMLGGD